jgi:asparagine synthase (glutamine-hydrolysing)
VSLLPGATCWEFGAQGTQKKKRYFDPSQWEAQEALGEEEFKCEFSDTFQRILPRYTEDNESVGIALTGGLDTRMIMACLPRTTTRHPCYTFVGETGLTVDARLAIKIAAVRGFEHHSLRIEPDFLRDFATHLDRTVCLTDGYAGATASHEIYFNARAREISPVRLTGNFGSEIFRSVTTFKPLGLAPDLLSKNYRAVVATEANRTSDNELHPVTFSAFREIPWGLFGLMAAGRSQVTFRTPYLDNDLVALAYRAPIPQGLSSRPAIRLIREASPQLARIPTDRGELLDSSAVRGALRRAYGELTFKLDYFHKEGLPTVLSPLDPLLNAFGVLGILGKHKFLPYARWFRNELAPAICERLSSPRVREMPWWAKNAPESLARKHISARGNYARELGVVLTLEAVDRLFLRSERVAKNPRVEVQSLS